MLRSIAISTVVLLGSTLASSLPGQEPSRLGINLSVLGTGQVGVTYQVSNGLALRPAVTFAWRKFSVPGGLNPVTTTDYGLSLGILATMARGGAVTSYLGAEGAYVFNHRSSVETGHTVGTSALFGVRARLIDRIHLYGEVGLAYSATGGQGTPDLDQLVFRTTPLAVLIYLK